MININTDFAKYLSRYFVNHIGEDRTSPRTEENYRYAFILLLDFFEKAKKIKAEKITLEMISKKVVLEFLNWLKTVRKCANSTLNNRLAAIHSFFRFLQLEQPKFLLNCQQILSIKSKKAVKENWSYLSEKAIKFLLQQPNTKTVKGKRDYALLSFLYNTGCRVQELIDITPSSFRLTDKHPVVNILGKGNKMRIVPLTKEQVGILRLYFKDNNLDTPHRSGELVFTNYRNEKLTRSGVAFVLNKYLEIARDKNESLIPTNISCHSLRHSRAMHWLMNGVDIVYIKDFLGHSHLETTERYARADSAHKRAALEKANKNIGKRIKPQWKTNDFRQWLKNGHIIPDAKSRRLKD